MDDKIKSNVEQPEVEGQVREGKRRTPNQRADHSRVKDAREAHRSQGVIVLGGGSAQGVSIESNTVGGSLETEIELALDQNDREPDGRRKFFGD